MKEYIWTDVTAVADFHLTCYTNSARKRLVGDCSRFGDYSDNATKRMARLTSPVLVLHRCAEDLPTTRLPCGLTLRGRLIARPGVRSSLTYAYPALGWRHSIHSRHYSCWRTFAYAVTRLLALGEHLHGGWIVAGNVDMCWWKSGTLP